MTKTIKVIIFPKDPNPYQDLLYNQLKTKIKLIYLAQNKTIVGAVLTVPTIYSRLIILRVRGFRIIHIHWLYPFYLPKKIPFSKQLSYVYIAAFLSFLKLLRFKVVWTVHNVLPHSQFTSQDLKINRRLSKLAAAKIVHSNNVIKDMANLAMSTDNISVIPIGSYGNIYADNISQQEARIKLNIASDEFVILFFGIVAYYKGTEDLIEVFNKLPLTNARLLIVGQCANTALKRKLIKAAKLPQIDFYEGFVADDEVAMYFKASNIVCLPFRKITTSSSVMLALSFAKPIITPKLGMLCDLPSNVGYFYEPADLNALQACLVTAARHRNELKDMGQQAKLFSDSMSWDKIAAKTYNLYFKL